MNRRPLGASLFIAATMLLASPATLAHHSGARYDTKQTVTITGVVTRFEWANPHVYVYVQQITDAGKKIAWEIECAPPAILRGIGWFPDTLRAGDTLTVVGAPARNANNHDLFPTVIKKGETTLFAVQDFGKLLNASATTKGTTKTTTLSGTWSTPIAALMHATSPAVSSMTKTGAEAFKGYDEKTSPTSHCIPSPAPMFMLVPVLKRISIDRTAILLESEIEASRRTIHMNAATHEGAAPSIQGHSIGRWEGKTLVIDTTHFAYHATGNGGGNGIGAGLPSSTQKHLVERLTPTEDGTGLVYAFELTDPEYLAVPKKGETRLIFSPEAKFAAEKCELDNARRFLKD